MKVTQLCLILCNPMDDKVHGILQARILEWVANHSLLQGIIPVRDRTQISHIAGGFFPDYATGKALLATDIFQDAKEIQKHLFFPQICMYAVKTT